MRELLVASASADATDPASGLTLRQLAARAAEAAALADGARAANVAEVHRLLNVRSASLGRGVRRPDVVEERAELARDLRAREAHLKGHLDATKSATALREAARCFRQAGCVNAARSAARRLHRVL